MFSLWKRLLFQLPPETAHHWTIKGLQWMQSMKWARDHFQKKGTVHDERLNTQLWNLTFPNPVGLAAGFDKHAEVYPGLAALGFGFVEVGTLTPKPQKGNEQPRLFRFQEDEAIINRMGFNNHGIEQAQAHFERLPRPGIPIGINLGKNRDTSNEEAVNDYCSGLRLLYPYGDYFVINISSPNTEGLRDLQQGPYLRELLTTLIAERNRLLREHYTLVPRPLLIKISPDLPSTSLEPIAEIVMELDIEGIIATNTTTSRHGLRTPTKESGGLSGRPLMGKSTQMIQQLYRFTQGKIPIIGVGGVFSGMDAYEKIRAGASLIQVYTGMIYRGPFMAKKINQDLLDLMQRDGASSLEEIIGVDS